MYSFNENYVQSAINKIGGPTKASNLLNVSNGAIHSWIKLGRVSNIDLAKKLAELSGVSLTEIRPC